MKYLALLFLLPANSFAGLSVLKYQSVSCQLLADGEVKKDMTSPLMTISIEDHLGRFAQIQFGDEQRKIQYQILIEDDVTRPQADQLVVLQNLMVGSVESSFEFVTHEPSWTKISQGDIQVQCELNRPLQ